MVGVRRRRRDGRTGRDRVGKQGGQVGGAGNFLPADDSQCVLSFSSAVLQQLYCYFATNNVFIGASGLFAHQIPMVATIEVVKPSINPLLPVASLLPPSPPFTVAPANGRRRPGHVG